ncbi:MAG TPA: aldehyde dehydrogenase family protein [Gaiellaceae bacterium]|jgi:NAD-dependent aldehyde dehydrogenases|nr:aldehyde dehydrogenase family protein [Gaiellaceae bacterium]
MAIAQTLLGEHALVLGGKRVETGDIFEIRSPFDGALVAVVHRAGAEEVESAIAGAVAAFEVTRHLPSWRRAEILQGIASGITERREELARTIALEAGKPIRAARIEAERAAFTFSVAAEESKRIYGEVVPLDWLPGNEGRIAHVRHVPLGPIAGITPFNFPLNLVAHKVAPALAAGNPIVLRPASQTPLASFALAEIVLAAGWPADGIAVLPCSTEVARPLVEDDRIKLLTFTGSPAVGWSLKGRAGRKRVTLELGGNAAVIVNADADVDYAAERVAWGGFAYAGQTCISVQRVYVHDSVYEEFTENLLDRVGALRVGDPLDEATDVGPLIDAGAAERVEEWVEEAVAGGAKVLAGGTRSGSLWQPTVLTGLREDMRVSCEEVFAPVVGLTPFADVRAAIDAAGRSEFGLQAGIFTNDMRVVDEAFDRLDVGGLMVNDVSSFRIDHMPYGGVKSSGLGREGLRYAIEEMSELKLLTLNRR